jgi:hypothetical protein
MRYGRICFKIGACRPRREPVMNQVRVWAGYLITVEPLNFDLEAGASGDAEK